MAYPEDSTDRPFPAERADELPLAARVSYDNGRQDTPPPRNRGGRRNEGRGDRRRQSPAPRCKCCEQRGHYVDTCWFLFPEIAPASWRTRENLAEAARADREYDGPRADPACPEQLRGQRASHNRGGNERHPRAQQAANSQPSPFSRPSRD